MTSDEFTRREVLAGAAASTGALVGGPLMAGMTSPAAA